MMTQRQANVLTLISNGPRLEKDVCSHVLGKTLERQGWVTRNVPRKVGKVIMLTITQKGYSALRHWEETVAPVIQRNRELRADIAHSLALIRKNNQRIK